MKRRCCDACRRRHRRCVTLSDRIKCNACIEADIDCRYDKSIRFKHKSLGEQAVFSSKVPNTIYFATPHDSNGSTRTERKKPSRRHDQREEPATGKSQNKTRVKPTGQPAQSPQTMTSPVFASPKNTQRNSIGAQTLQQSLPALRELPPFADLDLLATTASRAPPAFLTQREAHLFKIYIQNLAPSSDACDEARHFGVTVPRLALQEPVILNGILALASRYDARCKGIIDIESTHYNSLCMAQLRQALARPSAQWDSGLLAAVVIARLYEEYEVETDSHRHHLTGTRNLLNHEAIYRFVMQGGLAEAASFVHLRQSIYVFLVARCPVEIDLANFAASKIFVKLDDSSYANRMVYLLAKVLTYFVPLPVFDDASCTSPGENGLKRWDSLEREVESWFHAKPLSFSPIYFENANDEYPFPQIWMVADAPVVGLQHYYAAKAIICMAKLNSANTNIGYDAARLRRSTERTVAAHLGSLMALAWSNESTINAFYLPAHMLSLCGYCITNPLAQSHTIKYLKKVTEILQWKTSALIQTLQEQWVESTQG